MWHYFKRNKRGLRDTYQYLRVIQQEKNGDDFENFFQCSVNEISYRSQLCQSQVKNHIKALIVLGLVERKKILKVNSENKTFESSALYRIKKLTDDLIAKAKDKRDFAVIAYHYRKYKKKQ